MAGGHTIIVLQSNKTKTSTGVRVQKNRQSRAAPPIFLFLFSYRFTTWLSTGRVCQSAWDLES